MKYLRVFNTHSQYEAYKDSENYLRPNVSYCIDNNGVHYNWYDPHLVCTYNVTDISSATPLRTNYEQNIFNSMTVDGVLLGNLVESYQFSSTGTHIVKYELYDNTKVGNNAPCFYNIAALTTISIPNTVTTIGNNAFLGCTGITSIGRIGSGASVEMPSSVTSIGSSVFNSCTGLTTITIPSGVTTIETGAFQLCSGLTNVIIPSNVTSIGGGAFYNCPNLASVTVFATTPPTLVATGVFNNNASGRKIYVPAASVNAYKAATNWSAYASDIEAIPS